MDFCVDFNSTIGRNQFVRQFDPLVNRNALFDNGIVLGYSSAVVFIPFLPAGVAIRQDQVESSKEQGTYFHATQSVSNFSSSCSVGSDKS